MNADDLRERGEGLSEALAREAYMAGAGLADSTDFAGIFARYADLSSDEALDAAQKHPALLEWVVDNRIGRATAPLEDRMHAWEAEAVVELPGGEKIPYQRLAVVIANEPERSRRIAIDKARRAVLGTPSAWQREKLDVEREHLAQFDGGDTVKARTALSGIDLDALATQCTAFLSRTTDLYRDSLKERLRDELGITPADAVRSDASFMLRGAGHDDVFGAASLVPTARKQVAEMGLDAEAGGRIRFDTLERERKRSRAFCAPVRVPDEVYLVTRPFGGFVDYRAFWHELGHALHFGNAGRALPFEHRRLGDNSVTEAYAMLLEYSLASPAWLTKYTTMRGQPLKMFVREQAFNLLAIVRRYAAKLKYEISLHRLKSLDGAPPIYVELLTDATGFRYEPEDALLDIDDAFYAARYLRAWQLESVLRTRIIEQFDVDWFRNPRTGPALLELFELGQRDDAAKLARTALSAELTFDPLVAACEAGLA